MKILAIIPARSGSKGVPDKNIRPLAGHPLLALSIAAAKLSRRIDRVLVSTDSEEYAAIARRYGAEVPFLRPAELARDDSPDIEFILHALHWLQQHEGAVPDYLVHLRPTCPNRDPAILDRAVEAILDDAEATSLICVHPVEYPPCKYYKIDEQGVLRGYMGDEYVNRPRQLCPQAYQGNGHADIYRTDSILAAGSLLGDTVLPFVCPDPGDIDTEETFRLLDAHLHKAQESILDGYLSSVCTMP
jgi:N-acylneuraminate cytidylyltransferase